MIYFTFIIWGMLCFVGGVVWFSFMLELQKEKDE